jgi:hypothetical protein
MVEQLLICMGLVNELGFTSICLLNRSSSMSSKTCSYISGHHSNGYCYYNKSDCPYYPYGIQCYRYTTSCQSSTCSSMGGYYVSDTGTCYYWQQNASTDTTNDQSATAYHRMKILNCLSWRIDVQDKSTRRRRFRFVNRRDHLQRIMLPTYMCW